jgi:hypothetical protein
VSTTEVQTNTREITALDGTVEHVSFELLPLHDSTWGLCTGTEGEIYAAACGEHTGGLSVFIIRYDPETGKIEYLIECGPAIGEPPDNGRAPQCKIHYCLIPSSDGLLYCATHASGPPIGHPFWRPWNTWDDPERRFAGSFLFTFDPRTDSVDNFGIGPQREGTRALALDEKRGKLYGITWPRNHMFVFYIQSRQYVDLGRIGEINPQAVWLDRDGNAYTTDDYGYFLRIDAETNRIEQLNTKCPHEPHTRGWHNVAYDVIPSPDGRYFYGCDWGYESHLWRFDPYAGSDGKVESLGRALGSSELKTEFEMERYNVRGLVFGADAKLYFCMRLPHEGRDPMHLARLDVDTLEREVVAVLEFGKSSRWFHIASATADFKGNLYFAEAGTHPTGMYIYRPHNPGGQTNVFSFNDIKQWG